MKTTLQPRVNLTVRNTFVDIHYKPAERKEAERLAAKYKKHGYTLEADSDENVIQLLRTTISVTGGR